MPFVQAGDVRLHYVEHGSGPEPLVFVHGYIERVYAWSETLPRLPARYHAFAFDLRGAGLSDKPASGYGPQVYAHDLHLATQALGLDSFTWVGHSMGGLTGMQFALEHPDRLRRLVLVTPAPWDGLHIDPELRARLKAIRANREVRRRFLSAFMVRPLGDEYIDKHIDEDLSWCAAAHEQAMADARLAEAITRIQVPTLMVVGERDDLRDANLEDARRIPNCALHLFYRVGHMIQFDVPDACVALLDDFVQYGAAPAFSPEQRQHMLESILESA